MSSNSGIAYLRHIEYQKCELRFNLNYKDDKCHIESEIRAVRKGRDTVSALKKHISNKIRYILMQNFSESFKPKELLVNNFNIPIEFKNSGIEYPNDFVLSELFEEIGDIKFCIGSQKFTLEIDSPLVTSLTLPSRIFIDYNVSPIVQTLHTEYKMSEYFWSISKDMKQWEEVASGFYFVPSKEQNKMYLKVRCVPKNSFCSGPPFECIADGQIEEAPTLPEAPFAERHKFTATGCSGKT